MRTPASLSASDPAGPISRRRFTQLLALAAALPLTRPAARAAPAASVPLLGVQTSLARAAAVKAAGGQFIAESVSGFIKPDGSAAELEAMLAQVRAAPLPVYSCNFFIGRPDLRATGPDANHEAVLEYARKAFDRASRAGVKVITYGSCGSRKLPPGYSQERGKDEFVALLSRLGPLAQAHHITVAVESLQTRECNFLTRIAEVGQVVRRAGHPHIRAAADLYHMVAENDTPQDLADITDVLAHVELAELQGRRLPGTTSQDFRPYFRVLKDADYRGALCFEGNFELDDLPAGLAALAQQWQEA